MNARSICSILLLIGIVTACQSTAPTSSPEQAPLDAEIVLAPEQSSAVMGTDLTITFHAVVSDDRCPKEVECVASGPVTVSLSVQEGNGAPNDFTLQTFTDQNGRAPHVQFEGVTNRAEVGEYVIQIAAVTPYPEGPNTAIKASEYRVALLVSEK